MTLAYKLDKLHLWFRQNWWLGIFTTCTRLVLIPGFLFPGWVKVWGERFTDLHNDQPLGHYLEALFHTGYYYTFIGIMQMLAAILLLFPRTVIMGVMIYLPIILNITILSFSVRFEGSAFTGPLMVIACIYFLWWHYDRVKYILPLPKSELPAALPGQKRHKRFPFFFAGAVLATFVAVIFISFVIHDVRPRNTLEDCRQQFEGTSRTIAGYEFCDCVHVHGNYLDPCLDTYYEAPDDPLTNP
jgi:hypothetical protein